MMRAPSIFLAGVIAVLFHVPDEAGAADSGSVFVRGYGGDETFGHWTWQLPCLNGSVVPESALPAGYAIDYEAWMWMEFDSLENYSWRPTLPLVELQALDLRSLNLRFRGPAATMTVGKEIHDQGVNLIVNPTDFSPLDYYEPIRPNRMGLWGASCESGPAGAVVFLNQGPLFAESGPYRLTGPDVSLDGAMYEEDLGAAAWCKHESDSYTVALNACRSIDDTPDFVPVNMMDPSTLTLVYEPMTSIGMGAELLLPAVTLRHEFAYRFLDDGTSYGWGAAEATRTFMLSEMDQALRTTVFIAYVTDDPGVLSYDRLRKQAGGASLSLDITSDHTWQLVQEGAMGTKEKDLYSRTTIRYAPILGAWLEFSYQYSRVEDADEPRVGLAGISFARWF